MKRIIIAAALSLSLVACASLSTTNPVNGNNMYQAELVFDATLKTFNELKGLCANRVLPPVCRTYVVKGQGIIIKTYAADKAARNFATNNPTIDATNVVQAFTGLVSDFKGTVDTLSATKGQ